MKYKLFVALANFIILFNSLILTQLYAQNNKNDLSSKKLYINSYPDGTLVQISGPYSFIGRTPFVIPYKLFGKYKIKASKKGYENLNASIDLAKRGINRITIRLHKKTRTKAAIRSTFLPGWGQFYGQNNFKGFTLSIGQTTFGIISLFAVKNYINEKHDYELALEKFNNVRYNLEHAEMAYQIAKREFNEAENALKFQNAMIYLTVGFWIYNIFDSIFFFSIDKPSLNKSLNNRANFSTKINQNQLLFTMEFSL